MTSFGYAGPVARTAAGPALPSPGTRALGAAIAAVVVSLALADCGGDTPSSPSEDLPPSSDRPRGHRLHVPLRRDRRAGGLRPGDGGRPDPHHQRRRSDHPCRERPAPGHRERRGRRLPARGGRRPGTRGRFTLWPAASLTGLDAEYSGWLVYTASTSHDAPHGAQALQRLPASARQAFVLPSEEIRRDALAWAAHEDAVRMLNEALGGPGGLRARLPEARRGRLRDEARPETTPTARRGSGRSPWRAFGGTRSRRDVVFCTLEAARSFTVAHELGHTFGLQHSPHGAEIMYGWFLPHDPAGFCPREALAMSLMLQREPGNRFPTPTASPRRRASGEPRSPSATDPPVRPALPRPHALTTMRP